MTSFNVIETPMDERARFLYERRSGIGGSDVAAIMGFSQWKTANDVWEDKLGISDDGFDNELMLWGRLLEPVIRDHYAQVNGVYVHVMDRPMRNSKYPELVGNADGAVAAAFDAPAHKGLEVKTARRMDDWGESNTDEIPHAYLLQINHYMMVAGVEEWDVAVLFQGSMYRQYTIQANKELQKLIYEACSEFWHKHVVTGIAPPPQSFADCVKRWGGSNAAGFVVASSEQETAAAELVQIKLAIKDLEAESDALAFMVVERLQDLGDTLVAPDGRVLATWKLPKASSQLDKGALEKAHPKIYRAFQVDKVQSRRLLIKKST